MEVYQSDYLKIEKRGNVMVQQWSNALLSVQDYKVELYKFLDLFHKIKPQHLLWDNKDCKLALPESLDDWMGTEVLLPIYKRGLKRLILTVPEHTEVHLSIVKSLDKASSILQPIYFLQREEADIYTNQCQKKLPEEVGTIIECTLNRDQALFDVNLKVPPNELPHVLGAIKQLEQDREFRATYLKNYESLTTQELKIFKLIAQGCTNLQVAHRLFIEESSVKTHRKNIKQKLRIKSYLDVYLYARCFSLLP
jgi:DNA-binding CsgD family transcriptional regulator